MFRLLSLLALLLAALSAAADPDESCDQTEQIFPLQTNGVYPLEIWLCPGSNVRFENRTGRTTALEFFDRAGERAYTAILSQQGQLTGSFTFATRVELLYRNSDGYWYRTGKRSHLREGEAPTNY